MTMGLAGLKRLGQLSLFGKCLAMVAVIAAFVAGLVTFNSQALLQTVAAHGLRSLALDATQGVARQVSGATKFGKVILPESEGLHRWNFLGRMHEGISNEDKPIH